MTIEMMQKLVRELPAAMDLMSYGHDGGQPVVRLSADTEHPVIRVGFNPECPIVKSDPFFSERDKPILLRVRNFLINTFRAAGLITTVTEGTKDSSVYQLHVMHPVAGKWAEQAEAVPGIARVLSRYEKTVFGWLTDWRKGLSVTDKRLEATLQTAMTVQPDAGVPQRPAMSVAGFVYSEISVFDPRYQGAPGTPDESIPHPMMAPLLKLADDLDGASFGKHNLSYRALNHGYYRISLPLNVVHKLVQAVQAPAP